MSQNKKLVGLRLTPHAGLPSPFHLPPPPGHHGSRFVKHHPGPRPSAGRPQVSLACSGRSFCLCCWFHWHVDAGASHGAKHQRDPQTAPEIDTPLVGDDDDIAANLGKASSPRHR